MWDLEVITHESGSVGWLIRAAGSGPAGRKRGKRMNMFLRIKRGMGGPSGSGRAGPTQCGPLRLAGPGRPPSSSPCDLWRLEGRAGSKTRGAARTNAPSPRRAAAPGLCSGSCPPPCCAPRGRRRGRAHDPGGRTGAQGGRPAGAGSSPPRPTSRAQGTARRREPRGKPTPFISLSADFINNLVSWNRFSILAKKIEIRINSVVVSTHLFPRKGSPPPEDSRSGHASPRQRVAAGGGPRARRGSPAAALCVRTRPSTAHGPLGVHG